MEIDKFTLCECGRFKYKCEKFGHLPINEKYICPNCGSVDLAKIKGCIRCLKCNWKEDCQGW